MIEVIRYSPEYKELWDGFVKDADFNSFLFHRDYMEYHQDRFEDFSLLLFELGKLTALLPGNIRNYSFYSHQGLTFGGIIHEKGVHFNKLTHYYTSFISHLKHNNIQEITIKTAPFFYSYCGTQALDFIITKENNPRQTQILGAYINCSTHAFPKSSIEKRKLKLADFEIMETTDFDPFWKILEDNLSEYHNKKPVHTISEIQYLHNLFPENIKLFAAYNKETQQIDAGTILYYGGRVIKMQYIATSRQGRSNRAIHALYYSVINKYRTTKSYIDIGSCMDNGEVNTNLLYLKERYGASVYFSCDHTFNL